MLRTLASRIRFEWMRRINRVRPGFRYAHARVGGRRRVVYRGPDGRERALDLRDGTTDLTVFCEVFAEGEFEIGDFRGRDDVQRRYAEILASGKRPLIVDAGANIGLASLYFRQFYPDALIVAIEPEPANFAELQRHMGGDPLCRPIQAALASFDGHVQIVDPGHGEWAFQTEKSSEGVPAMRLSSIVRLGGSDAVPFVLKVDIEGFERDLFDDAATFDAFYLAYVELHDWALPGQGTSRSFLKAVASLDRDFIVHGQNVVSISNSAGARPTIRVSR